MMDLVISRSDGDENKIVEKKEEERNIIRVIIINLMVCDIMFKENRLRL